MENLSGVIPLTKRFFEQERDRIYSDPAYAIWRELITNSMDAGASVIKCEYGTEADGSVCYSVWDNGCGMSRDVLIHTYLTIDQTTKREGTVGGFGRARLLTCFSADGYVIESATKGAPGNTIRGHGAVWTLSVEESALSSAGEEQGTYVRAWNKSSFILNKTELGEKLVEFLGRCNLGVDVYINGELSNLCLQAGEEIGSVGDWGKAFLAQGGEENLIVRVNGVAMYSTTCRFPIIVDMEGARSRELLTANRDGLKWQASSTLHTLVSRLQTEGMAAFDPPLAPYRKVFEGYGLMWAGAHKAQPLPASEITGIATLDRVRSMFLGLEEREEVWVNTWTGFEKPNVKSPLASILPTTLVMTEGNAPELVAKAENFFPENWPVLSVRGGKPVFESKTHLWLFRILMGWTEAVGQALMLEETATCYASGFMLGEKIKAAHQQVGDWHSFLINPEIKDVKNPRFLLAAAMHEVTHKFCTHHDVEFAVRLTDSMAKVNQAKACAAIRTTMEKCA